jgi:hypothetical protein
VGNHRSQRASRLWIFDIENVIIHYPTVSSNYHYSVALPSIINADIRAGPALLYIAAPLALHQPVRNHSIETSFMCLTEVVLLSMWDDTPSDTDELAAVRKTTQR